MAEYLALSELFATSEGWHKGLAYRPDPTDIFISPYSKCGTTWMQQIVHGLRTGGDMEFGEISEVVPWVEMAHDLGLDPNAPQKARPHAFKSHLNWSDIPKGGRYIVVFRDPVDAMLSLYRFMEGWFFEPGAISLEDYAWHYLDGRDGEDYWTHAMSWWAQRCNPAVLPLAYEHMKQDLPGTVARVARFMGIEDQTHIAIATHQAGFDFMKAHVDRFDDNLTHRMRDAACGLPAGGRSPKVSTGVAGDGAKTVPPGIRRAMDEKWRATMGRAFGLKTYADLLSVF